MNITSILNEFNESNSLLYKRKIMNKYKDNENFIEIFQKTYDKVKWTWGITLKNIPSYVSKNDLGINYALKEIEKLHNREYTGNEAILFLIEILSNLKSDDAKVLERIIDRDLKIGFGKKEFNKIVNKNDKLKIPAYMRCGVYNEKTKSGINPDILQLKADGTYREFNKFNGMVTSRSRSGEEYDYPLLNNIINKFNDGIYHGELTVILSDELLEFLTPKIKKIDKKNKTNLLEEITKEFEEFKAEGKEYILPRQLGNGLLKSDDVPHKDIRLELWDCISHEEYNNARDRIKNTITYKERFYGLIETLKDNVTEQESQMIRLIPYIIITDVSQILVQVSEWMKAGYEGGVLKSWTMVFKDGTSDQQLKIKVIIDLEVRMIGHKDGRKGTKREGKIGSIQFGTDDGNIKGFSSGFSDDMLDEISENIEKYMDKVFTVQCNDITKGRNNNYFALSHPRFIEWRDDKDYTDDLERALEIKEMSMMLS